MNPKPLLLIPVLLLAACHNSSSSDTPSAAAAQIRNRGFVSAKITRYFDQNDNPVKSSSKTVTDAVDLNKLIAFFPAVDTARNSPLTGDWKSHVDIRFTRSDGTTLKVNSDYKVWSEGNGDFPLRGNFRQFIATLFASP